MRRRGSITLEAALSLPLAMVIFGAVAQVLLTSQARVHVEQAAYAAARSALVHKCRPIDPFKAIEFPLAAVAATKCTDAPQKWEDAARWALVAAGSPNSFAQGRGCPTIEAGYQLMAGSGQLEGYDDAARAALCYAYEPGNLQVDANWGPVGFGETAPIIVTVTFRYPLSTPFRRFIDTGKRGDGTYYREESVTVRLL